MQEITRCMEVHHHILNQVMIIKALVLQNVDYGKQPLFYGPLATIERALQVCECEKQSDLLEDEEDEEDEDETK